MKPKYYNEEVISLYERAGILPFPGTREKKCALKDEIRKQVRILDEQDAVTRYTWENFPCNITSLELERLIYYYGQLAFFYSSDFDEFFVLPYALSGTLDFYGRFRKVHPVPLSDGGEKDEATKRAIAQQASLLSTLELDVLYSELEDDSAVDVSKCCVLLSDYSKQLSQTVIPRQQLQDGLLGTISEMIPLLRTNLLNASGVDGVRVGSEDEQSNVTAANDSVERAALTGKRWVPIVGTVDFQNLSNSGSGKNAETLLMSLQALDNFRRNLYGIENGGTFEKKQYQNETQTNLNGSQRMGSPLFDGLSIRQHFCDVVNSAFGLNVSCRLNDALQDNGLNVEGQTPLKTQISQSSDELGNEEVQNA